MEQNIMCDHTEYGLSQTGFGELISQLPEPDDGLLETAFSTLRNFVEQHSPSASNPVRLIPSGMDVAQPTGLAQPQRPGDVVDPKYLFEAVYFAKLLSLHQNRFYGKPDDLPVLSWINDDDLPSHLQMPLRLAQLLQFAISNCCIDTLHPMFLNLSYAVADALGIDQQFVRPGAYLPVQSHLQ